MRYICIYECKRWRTLAPAIRGKHIVLQCFKWRMIRLMQLGVIISPIKLYRKYQPRPKPLPINRSWL
jgi:hypothetical protein